MRKINRASDFLHLNEAHIHINLHDMMRLYLQKVGPKEKFDIKERVLTPAAQSTVAPS